MSGSGKGTKTKPKFEFGSKRVVLLTSVLCGGALYYFSGKPYLERRKHQNFETEARKYWEIHRQQKLNPQPPPPVLPSPQFFPSIPSKSSSSPPPSN